MTTSAIASDVTVAEPVPPSAWKWFGSPGHFICARWCRFHLCTLVGDYLVSTVGEYVPSESMQVILAEMQGVKLVGSGERLEADFLRKVGFQEIGLNRLYETMVFRAGAVCQSPDCCCGLPTIDGHELDFRGYNVAGEAAAGHLALCEKWARRSSPSH